MEEKKEIEIKVIKLPIVDQLEENAKCGFFVQAKEDPSCLEPLVRLACEGKPAVPEEGIEEEEPTILCPWSTVSSLTLMLQGALYLHPLLMKVVKDHNGNAQKPKE